MERGPATRRSPMKRRIEEIFFTAKHVCLLCAQPAVQRDGGRQVGVDELEGEAES